MATVSLAPRPAPVGARPPVASAVEVALRAEVLVVGEEARDLGAALVRRGCPVAYVPDLQRARSAIRRAVYSVVVVAPDVAGQDGVAFTVQVKNAGPLAWAPVPFLILPEPLDSEFLVYRGYDDFSPGSTTEIDLAEVVMDLIRGT